MRVICNVCGFTKEEDSLGNCPVCNNSIWIDEDIILLQKISSDESFLNAMIDLKKKDPIEYQLKLNQFKVQLEQQQSMTAQVSQQSSAQIKCPTCGSTNIKKISASRKLAGAIGFGLFSKTAKSQFECVDCKYKW